MNRHFVAVERSSSGAAGLAVMALLVWGCRPPATVLVPITNPASSPGADAKGKPLAPYALPRMGSGGYGFAYGSAFPGATVPNGMARVGPETTGPYSTLSALHFSGYWAGDNTILAFSHLHLHGTGAQDYGVLGVLPVPAFNPLQLRVEDYKSTFASASEVSTPGYYGVTLDNGAILSEMTATTHAAHERFTFPATSSTGTVLIDLNHIIHGTVISSALTLDPDQNAITGDFQTQGGMSGGFHLYFTIRFKQAWSAAHVWSDLAAPASVLTISGTGVAVALDFALAGGAPVEMQVGLSLVSAAGAATNLSTELTGWAFDATHAAAVQAWNDRLNTITIYPAKDQAAQVTTFYSALHHAFVMPGIYSDTDGSYRYAGTTAMASGFHFLNDISGWDIYRTLTPLYVLVAPDVSLDLVQSLYSMAKISTNFPKWPLATSDAGTMIGASADVIISDAYVKGVTGFDSADVYKRLRDAALDTTMPTGEGRGGRDYAADYMANSFVPAGDGPCVSLTCELTHEDFALAQFAQALGQTADATALLARSHGWEKLYDPTSGFLRHHTSGGQIPDDSFDPADFSLSSEYDEADAYQTMFCPQGDIEGLAQVWGGNDKLVAALSNLFAESKVERETDDAQALNPMGIDPNLVNKSFPPKYYFGGNEPDVHYAYLFAAAGRPDLTQQWIAWVRQEYFSSAPDGIPGNDDGGTMTAWYVFSSIGFYPIPGSDQYVIGTPAFGRTDLKVAGGVFTVTAPNVSNANIYVQSATLNGQPLTTAMIHHSDLKAGGTLELVMGGKPSKWGQTGN